MLCFALQEVEPTQQRTNGTRTTTRRNLQILQIIFAKCLRRGRYFLRRPRHDEVVKESWRTKNGSAATHPHENRVSRRRLYLRRPDRGIRAT